MLFIIFLYYVCNVHGISSDDFTFLSNNIHLHILFFFLDQPGEKFIKFIDVSNDQVFVFIDFLCFPFFNIIDFCSNFLTSTSLIFLGLYYFCFLFSSICIQSYRFPSRIISLDMIFQVDGVFLQTLTISFYPLLACMVSDQKSDVILIFVILYVKSSSLLHHWTSFKVFFSILVFCSLNMI